MEGKSLRIVFMGTPDFAVESLHALVESGHQVVGVITAPDKPAGRGRQMAGSAVKKYAEEHGLPVLQPEKLKDPVFLAQLKALEADLQVVVAFRMLPQVVWAMPRLGTFNLHASLLPQYRGAAPINWAIINGETETGVTTFLLDHEIDTGKILFSEKTPIGKDESCGELHDRLMAIGAKLVVKTVGALASGSAKALPQQEVEMDKPLQHAPKIFKEDTQIDWEKTAQQIHQLVRGLSPYPAAWTNLLATDGDGQIAMKIFQAKTEIAAHGMRPGTLASNGKTKLSVACADGWLHLVDIQVAGKKRMMVDEFLRGFKEIGTYRAG